MRAPRSISLCFVLICATILFLLSTQPAYAFSPIFVTPNGRSAGNSSFANATTLQHALSIAHPGDQIWVATGIYTPGLTVDDTFLLPHGVAIYGGFALNATQLSQRDWLANPSVLSGDIDGNDETDAHGVVTDTTKLHGANSLHVLTADGTSSPITDTTRVDGFIVTAGDATPGANGGGLYCDGENGGACNPHIENVNFAGNKAQDGGAIFNISFHGVSSPSLVNLTFSGNTASVNGGAVYNDGDYGKSSPTLNNVTFASNSAHDDGGAMYNNSAGDHGNSSPSLANVTFVGNSAHDDGGAMYNYSGVNGASSPTLVNVTFSGNSANVSGGAMANDGNHGASSPTLVNVTFSGNSAIYYGGAIFNDGDYGASSPTLVNVTFSGNSTGFAGGAMENDGDYGVSNPSLINVIFSGNSTSVAGGAMANNGYQGSSNPSLVDVTFYSNTAGTNGGALYNDTGINGGSGPLLVNVTFFGNSAQVGGAISNYSFQGEVTPNLFNVILWDNSAPVAAEIDNYHAIVFFKTSLVQGGISGAGIHNKDASVTDGGGNLDADPLFVDVAHGNLRLKAGSPAIDSGTNSAIGQATDSDGNPRKIDGDENNSVVVDMGAYEFQVFKALNVTVAGNGSGQIVRAPVGAPCSAPCSALYGKGTAITLTATAATTATFSGWGGDCAGTGSPPGACHLTMDAAKHITATFALKSYPLTIQSAGNGSGSVNNQPNQPSYLFGTVVTLTASANPGSTFTGWSGDCTGPGNPPGLCYLTIDTSNNVIATFVRNDPPSFSSTPGLTAIIGAAYSYAATVGDPDSGDTLTLSTPLTRPWLTLTPTGNGTATLTGTPGSGDVGANAVQLRAQDQVGAFATQSFTITVAAADPNTTGSVQGKVEDEQNKGLAGATLALSNASGQAVAAALLIQTTGSNGNYLFEGVRAGNYTITASMVDHASSASKAVTVQAGHTTTVPTITLQTSKSLLHLPLLDRAP